MLLEQRGQQQLQTSLKDCIIVLSKESLTEIQLKEIVQKLFDIYSNKEFRHSYSAFYPLIAEIDDISSLQENLSLIVELLNNNIENMQQDEIKQHIFKSIHKLVDHLSLEIIRYTNVSQIIEKSSVLNKELKDTKKDLQNAKRELKRANEKLEHSKVDVITTLSIFSAIIITFTGGFSLVSKSFEYVYKTPTLKLTLFVFIIGVILFNAIYLLLHVVSKIIDKNIHIECIKPFNIIVLCAIVLNLVLLKIDVFGIITKYLLHIDQMLQVITLKMLVP